MKIAHLLPLGAQFPLKKHNGRYEWALRLAKAQAAAGHDVSIYCGESDASSEPTLNFRTIEASGPGKRDRNTELILAAFTDESIDVFHSHFDSLAAELSSHTRRPIVTTQHWFPTEPIAKGFQLSPSRSSVAVPVTHLMKSQDQALCIPHSDVIYHGIDLDIFHPIDTTPSERFLFVGRITDSKGVKEAVEYCKSAGVPLDIIGKVNHVDEAYFASFQQLLDDEMIVFHGPKSSDEVMDFMAHAKCLIFPSKAPEAFGQVTVEAQACGTPVIISDIGASAELVPHEKTGFICQNEADYLKAISNVDNIHREDCRHHAEKFDFSHMVKQYEDLYRVLLEEY